jgi:hypothetical protein
MKEYHLANKMDYDEISLYEFKLLMKELFSRKKFDLQEVRNLIQKDPEFDLSQMIQEEVSFQEELFKKLYWRRRIGLKDDWYHGLPDKQMEEYVQEARTRLGFLPDGLRDKINTRLDFLLFDTVLVPIISNGEGKILEYFCEPANLTEPTQSIFRYSSGQKVWDWQLDTPVLVRQITVPAGGTFEKDDVIFMYERKESDLRDNEEVVLVRVEDRRVKSIGVGSRSTGILLETLVKPNQRVRPKQKLFNIQTESGIESVIMDDEAIVTDVLTKVGDSITGYSRDSLAGYFQVRLSRNEMRKREAEENKKRSITDKVLVPVVSFDKLSVFEFFCEPDMFVEANQPLFKWFTEGNPEQIYSQPTPIIVKQLNLPPEGTFEKDDIVLTFEKREEDLGKYDEVILPKTGGIISGSRGILLEVLVKKNQRVYPNQTLCYIKTEDGRTEPLKIGVDGIVTEIQHQAGDPLSSSMERIMEVQLLRLSKEKLREVREYVLSEEEIRRYTPEVQQIQRFYSEWTLVEDGTSRVVMNDIITDSRREKRFINSNVFKREEEIYKSLIHNLDKLLPEQRAIIEQESAAAQKRYDDEKKRPKVRYETEMEKQTRQLIEYDREKTANLAFLGAIWYGWNKGKK